MVSKFNGGNDWALDDMILHIDLMTRTGTGISVVKCADPAEYCGGRNREAHAGHGDGLGGAVLALIGRDTRDEV